MSKKKEKTFFEMIKLDFQKIILGSIVLNALFLLFGIIIYIRPYITLTLAGILLGISFILQGLFAIYEFLMRKVSPLFSHKIFVGVLSIILGIFVIINPFEIIKVLTLALGIYIGIVAICKFLEALKLKKVGYDGWLLVLVMSIILLIFGVFIGINPMASIDIVQATGIFIILSSILEIANLFMIYSKAKDIAKLFKKAK